MKLNRTILRLVVLCLAVAVLAGCERGRVNDTAALLEQCREQVKKLDTPGVSSLTERIDSLAADPRAATDTLVAEVCGEVAQQLRVAKCYKELNTWVSDAGDQLERITVHEREMIERILMMKLTVAESFFELRVFDRFMQGLIQIEPTAKRYGLNDLLAAIQIDKASIYNEKGQYDKALSVLQAVIDDKDIINVNDVVIAYNNAAWAWKGKGNYDKAVQLAMLALNHVPENDQLMQMRTRSNIGTYYNRMSEYSLAQKQLEMAIDYYQQHDVYDELCGALPKLAISQWKQGNVEQARATFERAMDMRHRGPIMAKTGILSNYAKFCAETGDRDKQIDLLQQLITVNDSILLGNSNDTLTQLYSDEMERNDKNLTDYQRSRITLWSVIGVMAVLMSVVTVLLVRRIRRERTEKAGVAGERDTLHEQLIQASIDQERCNSLNESLATDLQQMQRQVMDAPRKDMQKRLRSLTQQVLQAQSDRGDDLMSLAHADFFHTLMERYPELTNNDLRVCALLRRNISSKEIAAILCREPHTIDVTRMRLRRKFNLQPEDDLCQFLMKISFKQ